MKSGGETATSPPPRAPRRAGCSANREARAIVGAPTFCRRSRTGAPAPLSWRSSASTELTTAVSGLVYHSSVTSAATAVSMITNSVLTLIRRRWVGHSAFTRRQVGNTQHATRCECSDADDTEMRDARCDTDRTCGSCRWEIGVVRGFTSLQGIPIKLLYQNIQQVQVQVQALPRSVALLCITAASPQP